MIPDLSENLAACLVDSIGEHTKTRHSVSRIWTRLEMAAALMSSAAQNHQAAASVPHPLDAVGDQVIGRRAADG
jgi:hypothetical protein